MFQRSAYIPCSGILVSASDSEMTAIGYPSKDSRPICNMRGYEAMAISARCLDKDAAWSFIESCLIREGEHQSM